VRRDALLLCTIEGLGISGESSIKIDGICGMEGTEDLRFGRLEAGGAGKSSCTFSSKVMLFGSSGRIFISSAAVLGILEERGKLEDSDGALGMEGRPVKRDPVDLDLL
jgi:hypothetical protein